MTSIFPSIWQTAPKQLSLIERHVDLWRFSLEDDNVGGGLLSAEEQKRVRRLCSSNKAHHAMVARTRLRQILARYLGTAPEGIKFSYNEQGKPGLGGNLVRKLSCNLSHSGVWGLCAVAMGSELGVDLQMIDYGLNYHQLAQRFFSAGEVRCLESAAEARRRRTFFRLWTRKEAWLKGKGGGFSEPELELDKVHLAGTATTAGGWTLMHIPVIRGYVGALAFSGKVDRVNRYSW